MMGTSFYYSIFDGMCWPNHTGLDETEYRLRYSELAIPSKFDLLFAASVLSAYRELIFMPQKRRNKIIQKIKQMENK